MFSAACTVGRKMFFLAGDKPVQLLSLLRIIKLQHFTSGFLPVFLPVNDR